MEARRTTLNNTGNGDSESPSLIRNGLYNTGGQALCAAVSLLTVPFLIRFLGLREYGVWSLAYAAVLASMTVGNGGLTVAATVFLSKDLAECDRTEASRTLTCVLGSAALLGAMLGLLLLSAGPLILRPLVAFGSAERAEVGRALQIAGLGVSLFILQSTLVGVEQAFDRYAVVNGFQIFQSVLTNVGLTVVAWFGGRVVSMMKWQVFVYAALLAAHCWFVFRLLRGKRLRLQWGGSKAKQIFRFSLATWVSILGSDVFSQWSRWIVGAVLGAPTLGVYSAITNMTAKINSFSGMAVQPLVPSLSRDAATNIPAEGRIRQAAHLNALIAIEAGIFLYVLADWVMQVMVPGATGPQDILGLQIASIIYALYSINAPGYFILFSVGEARTNASVVLSSAVVSLGLISIGAWRFGLLGAIGGNAGFWGTLLLVPFGLKRVGLTVRRYVMWIALPFLGLAAALFAGLVLAQYFWWRVAFVVVQAALFTLWFWREQDGLAGLKVGWGRVAQG